VRVDRVPVPVVLIGVVVGLVCVVLIARDEQLSTTTLVVGGVGLLVLLVATPIGVLRGVAAVAAVAVGYVVAPNNGPHRTQYEGIAVVVAVLVAALARTLGQDRRLRVGVGGLVGSAAYLGLFLASTAVSRYATGAVDLAFAVAAPAILMVLVGRRFTGADLRVFARGFIGLAILQVLASVIDVFVRPVPFLGYWYYKRSTNELLGSVIPRAQGLAGHPILLSTVLGVAILLNWRNLAQLRRGLSVSVTVLLVFGFALSGTRSGLVALVVALGSLAIVNATSTGRRARNVVLLLVLALVGAANQSIADGVARRVASLGQSGSFYHRAAALSGLPELLASWDLPTLLLGLGRGSEQSVFGAGFLQQDGLTIIDNQFVTTVVVGGLVGLGALSVLVVRTIVRSTATLRATMIFTVVMFNSFDILRWIGPSLVVFLLIALADNPQVRPPARPEPAPGSVAPPD
jgi:hypothetical protein